MESVVTDSGPQTELSPDLPPPPAECMARPECWVRFPPGPCLTVDVDRLLYHRPPAGVVAIGVHPGVDHRLPFQNPQCSVLPRQSITPVDGDVGSALRRSLSYALH